MDDIKQRLEETSKNCLESYQTWDSNKETKTRENLQEAIHELRKVASRLEIEITLSERQATSAKKIPIPSHRSNSKSKGAIESILPDEGNTAGSHTDKKPVKRTQRSRRPAPKRNES